MFKLDQLKTYKSSIANIIKNLKQEITPECIKHGIKVDDDVIEYVLLIYSLNPMYNLSHIARNKLEEFMRMCLVKIKHFNHPSFVSLRIQIKFQVNFIEDQIIINSHRDIIRKNTSKLVYAIMQRKSIPKNGHDKLVRLLSFDVILYNILGKTNSENVHETFQSIYSIMSKHDLNQFVTLDEPIKRDTLQDIREIVCGIRIFNNAPHTLSPEVTNCK